MSSTLACISHHAKGEQSAVDVVFVHGLGGTPQQTWTASNGGFWPEWLAEDLPSAGIWTLGYESTPARPGQAMPIADRAFEATARLRAYGLGAVPLVFVCHSLGGLLLKQMLRNSLESGTADSQWLARETVGVVFLATPHTGATSATWAERIRRSFDMPQLRELSAGPEALRDLNQWYRNNVRRLGIRHQVYSEARALRGVTIVDSYSADPGVPGLIPIPLDEDHVSICKPKDRSSLLYIRVRAFVVHFWPTAQTVNPSFGTEPTRAVVATLPEALLRRELSQRFGRHEVAVLWFDTFGDAMDDHVPGKPLSECIIELLLRASREGVTIRLYDSIALERPDLASILSERLPRA